MLVICVALSACSSAGREHEGATGMARRALDHPEIRWTDARTEHFHLHVSEGIGLDRSQIRRLEREVEAVRGEVLEMLGGEDGGTKELFFVESRERMREISGQAAGGSAWPGDRTVLLTITPKTRAPLRHELTHLYSLTLWGDRYERREWLREGVAMVGVGRCHGWTAHELAAALQDGRKLVPMARLIDRFREHDDVVTYLQSGSLARYVVDRHGMPALRALYQGGAQAAPRAIGMDVAALDAAWRREIARPEHRRRAVSLDAIRADGCE
ncbi:MAG TPA: hypothetical protein VFR81_18490 [Longimicrobium sp.]|nr:hypothetical protein [Longimicrobium sp.]